jgi:signal peptidase I
VHFDFAALLVLLSALTGFIWLLDALFFAKSRKARAETGAQVKEPLIVEYARSFFPVIFIVLIVRSFLAEPFRIPSNSMMPTLLTGDFVLVSKFSYGIRLPVLDTKIIPIGEPQRGDVFVFRYPGYACEGRAERSARPCGEPFAPVPFENYIKRVIGLPGDVIEVHDKVVTVNGVRVDAQPLDRYVGVGSGREMTGALRLSETLGEKTHDILVVPNLRRGGLGEGRWEVPEGHYFAMGDNRDNSQDSRFWGFVPEEALVGKAFLIWMNWDGKNGGVDFSRIGTVIH